MLSFEGLRNKVPGQLLPFTMALREAWGLSTMLEIIHEAGEDIVNTILGVNLVDGLVGKIRKWQQVIIDLLYIWRLITDFSEAFSAEALLSKVKYYSNNNLLS